jgi:signal transduction histidine kinase
LFKKSLNESTIVAPPGVSQMYLYVVDQKRKVRYRFHAGPDDVPGEEPFHFLDASSRTVDHALLEDVFRSRTAMSMALSYGEGWRKYIYVIPYEKGRNKWRFACIQVTTAPSDPDTVETPELCGLSEDRVCFVITDSSQIIRSVSSLIPESFGYSPVKLPGTPIKNMFSLSDYSMLQASSADARSSGIKCLLFCLDGSKRDVVVRKFILPDKHILYGICDVSPRQRGEELSEVTARERQRIGQDLHDSVGQTLTGISLLSRSLSNVLQREDHKRSVDASQVSGLADEASNQIRQISRGLMPSEVVQNGLCDSLRELARVTASSCGIACEAQLDENLKFADMAVESHLYRIAQEAVNNSVRHSKASRIDIVISETDSSPRLEVIDDGQWVEPEENDIGIGLKTMRYRATAVGGRLQISSRPDGGTSICCRLESEESLETRL